MAELASDRFGWAELSAEQTEAMSAASEGRDVLLVLPTGARQIGDLPGAGADGDRLAAAALQRDQIEGLDAPAARRGLPRPRASPQRSSRPRARVRRACAYAETTGCRRRYLLGYFGDAGEFRAENVVRHAEWGRGVVMTVEEDKLTVLYDDVGYRPLSLPVVRDQELPDRC